MNLVCCGCCSDNKDDLDIGAPRLFLVNGKIISYDEEGMCRNAEVISTLTQAVRLEPSYGYRDSDFSESEDDTDSGPNKDIPLEELQKLNKLLEDLGISDEACGGNGTNARDSHHDDSSLGSKVPPPVPPKPKLVM